MFRSTIEFKKLYISLTALILFLSPLVSVGVENKTDLLIFGNSFDERILIARAAPNSEVRQNFLTGARKEALNVLATAYHKPGVGETAKGVYGTLWNYLNKPVLFFAAPGKEYTYCIQHPDTAAFFDRASQTIHFCSSYLESAEFDRTYLVGSIIHEAAHATGMDTFVDEKDYECGATSIPISAFNHAGRSIGSLIRCGYISSGRCKIKSSFRITDTKA